jgi:NADH:ubiquinone oxidoreductase subunit
MIDRKRYVMTADGVDEATEIPAEWHGWLHYTVDEVLSAATKGEVPVKSHDWQGTHERNLTGTPSKYVPYSTTIPKISEYNGGASK